MNNKIKLGLIVMLAGCVAGNLMAGNFTSYATGDVLIGFRNAGSAVELVVDAGPISTFINYAHNTTNPITAYSASQLVNDVGTASTSWSAFTWTGDFTLYLSSPRATNTLNVQTAPYPEAGGGLQQSTSIGMNSIVKGATANVNNVNYPNSTPTAVEEDDDSNGDPNYPSGISYFRGVAGAYGNSFNGTVAINPEQKIPSHFTTLQRSDFYQVSPSSSLGLGTYLGYFELETNGTMVYVAYPTAVPVIKSVSYANGTTTINYSTGTYGTYTLQATNGAGLTAPRSTWPVVSTLSTGDTAVHTVTDVSGAANKFYIISGN